jgi:hypothetical protein
MYGKYIFLVVKILYLKRRKFKKLNFLKITSEHQRDPKGQLSSIKNPPPPPPLLMKYSIQTRSAKKKNLDILYRFLFIFKSPVIPLSKIVHILQ